MSEQQKMRQVLLRLPTETVQALIQRSGEIALERLERVTIQSLIKEAIEQYLGRQGELR